MGFNLGRVLTDISLRTGGRLPALDGIRALAITLVLLFHLLSDAIPGPLGVTAFFVLSGFLITWLLCKEEERTTSIDFAAFYWRRALRILPPLLFITAVDIVAHRIFGKPIPWIDIMAANFFWMDYRLAFSTNPGVYLGSTWSLAIEEQFYFLWPVTFYLLRANPLRRMRLVAIGIVVIWLWRFSLAFILNARADYIYHAFDTRVDALLVGCLAALALRSLSYPSLTKYITRKGSWLPAILLAIVYATAYCSTRTSKYFAVELVIEPPLIMVAIINLVFGSSLLQRLLDLKPMIFLGSLSYSLYLNHTLIAGLFSRLFPDANIAILLVVIIGSSAMSLFLLEAPILKLKGSRWWRAN